MENASSCEHLQQCNLFRLISNSHETSRQITLNYASAQAAKNLIAHSFGQFGTAQTQWLPKSRHVARLATALPNWKPSASLAWRQGFSCAPGSPFQSKSIQIKSTQPKPHHTTASHI